MFSRPVWAEIDLEALKNNVRAIRRKVKNDKKIMAVIKANAYGHGAVPVAEALKEEGISNFAVAILEEALELRRAGITEDILILGWTPPEDFEEAIKNNITLCIYDLDEAKILDNVAMNLKMKARVHIKLDTGMTRIGFLPNEENLGKIIEIIKLPDLLVEGIFTHFSKADETDKTYAKRQMEIFTGYVDKIEKVSGYEISVKHLANSASILDLPQAHFNMVRAGIILYGLKPSDEVDFDDKEFKPVMSLKARLSRVESIPADTLVSYGGIYKTEHSMKIGTIPIGYADGYTRLLTGKGQVVVKGQKKDIIGKICMDQCMVDLDGIEDVQKGEEVTLIGGNLVKETADDIAEKLGTINYEVVCMISARVPRIYK